MSKSETEEIKQLVEQRVEAIRAKDAARATSMMSADSVLFDVVDPLQSKGARVAKNRAENGLLRSKPRSAMRFMTCRSAPVMALLSATA